MAEGDTQVIPVILPDGTAFKIEVRRGGGYQEAGVLDRLPLDEVMKVLVGLGTALNTAIEKVAPKKAAIEFGIEVALEQGKLTALLVQGKMTANLSVKLEWER